MRAKKRFSACVPLRSCGEYTKIHRRHQQKHGGRWFSRERSMDVHSRRGQNCQALGHEVRKSSFQSPLFKLLLDKYLTSHYIDALLQRPKQLHSSAESYATYQLCFIASKSSKNSLFCFVGVIWSFCFRCLRFIYLNKNTTRSSS